MLTAVSLQLSLNDLVLTFESNLNDKPLAWFWNLCWYPSCAVQLLMYQNTCSAVLCCAVLCCAVL